MQSMSTLLQYSGVVDPDVTLPFLTRDVTPRSLQTCVCALGLRQCRRWALCCVCVVCRHLHELDVLSVSGSVVAGLCVV